MSIKIKYISTSETIDLRQGRPRSSSHMEGDNLESTKHIGAFIDSRCVGVLSLFLANTDKLRESSQYQLRGMAVDPEYQGKDIGRILVNFSEKKAKRHKC